MIYPICNGQLLTKGVVNLVQNKPLVFGLFSPEGFQGGTRFFLNEVVDKVNTESNNKRGFAKDENDLLESFEILYPEVDLPIGADCISLKCESGFQNLGTRRLNITEVTPDGKTIIHDPIYFDVAVGSRDQGVEHLTTRYMRTRRLLLYVVVAVVGLMVYIIAMDVKYGPPNQFAKTEIVNEQIQFAQTNDPYPVACPMCVCPNPDQYPEQKVCEVCKDQTTCPTCAVCPQQAVGEPQVQNTTTNKPVAEPPRPFKPRVTKKNFGHPLHRNKTTYYR